MCTKAIQSSSGGNVRLHRTEESRFLSIVLTCLLLARNITTVRLARSLRLLLTLHVSIYYLSSREQGIRDNTASFELSFLI